MVYHSAVLFVEKGPTLLSILLLHASVSILANISRINVGKVHFLKTRDTFKMHVSLCSLCFYMGE